MMFLRIFISNTSFEFEHTLWERRYYYQYQFTMESQNDLTARLNKIPRISGLFLFSILPIIALIPFQYLMCVCLHPFIFSSLMNAKHIQLILSYATKAIFPYKLLKVWGRGIWPFQHQKTLQTCITYLSWKKEKEISAREFCYYLCFVTKETNIQQPSADGQSSQR